MKLRDECYFEAADTLERALKYGCASVGLTIRERIAVLDVLDDTPAGLEQLRGVFSSSTSGVSNMGLRTPACCSRCYLRGGVQG